MKAPHIKITPPGPKAREIIQRDDRFLATSTKTSPLVVRKAKGAVVEDVDGNLYIDFTSGVSVTNLGHVNEDVLEAVEAQLKDFWHFAGTDFYYDIQVEAAELLARLTPGDHAKKVFFTNSGTESIEAAIKLARWNKEGKQFLAFLNAFHGRTMGALALTASKKVQRERFAPWMPGVTHVPYAYCYRCPYQLTYPECSLWCATTIEKNYLNGLVPPKELAALFFEPIQGEGGYILPPPGWTKEIERIARENDILLVADEVQTGIGRTGAMFAVEHSGVVPDVIALAKGLGSGLPIGAIVFDARLDFGVKGAHSNTFGGNALGCAAAVATLKTIEREGLHKRAAVLGEAMHKRLEEMRGKFPIIGDNRGIGLMQATELVGEGMEPAVKQRNRVVEEALKKGLILLPCGQSSVRYIPPLTIEDELLTAGLGVLEESFKAVS